MSWLHADPVEELTRLLNMQRDERNRAQVALASATYDRNQAMADVDRHNAAIAQARQRVHDATAEIDELLCELHQLIPRQRRP